MKVGNTHYQTVWMENGIVKMIDQSLLPFKFEIIDCENYLKTTDAIKTMIVRGAGAIGAAAGYAMAQACLNAKNDNYKNNILDAKKIIEASRPTAQNLFYATNKVYNVGLISANKAVEMAYSLAQQNSDDCKQIGINGAELIQNNFNIATHCNAGWLAFVDYGSALSPIYIARDQGKKVNVFVDETRPRNQGAKLTAWELEKENIEHKIIPDNALASFMQEGKIDMMIVGADRIAANGDTANKIGTLEKAIAAKYFGIPFYVAAPYSTIDFNSKTGKDIIIENRSENEVLYIDGINSDGEHKEIRISNPGSSAINPAFDVTPNKLITAFITEKGIINEL